MTSICNIFYNYRMSQKCNCSHDVNLPCCAKAAQWLNYSFRKRKDKFNYIKHKEIYDVLILIILEFVTNKVRKGL